MSLFTNGVLALQQMTVSVHKLSYPGTTDGGTYSSGTVDGDGWIGGYDMADDGSVSISGDTYTAGGTASICQDGANSVADGAQDPMDVNATSSEAPDGTPAAGLLWPEGFSSVSFGTEVLDYAVGGATENWVNLADHGNGEIDVLAGEWIGVMLAYTGTGGGDDEATGFFYAEGSGLAEPWAFMKFYAGCGGTSGNGGWHIRHWLIRYELAVELTGDRAPVIQDYTVLSTTLDEGDRAVEATVTDDNPSGEAAGVASVVLSYSTDDSIYTDVAMTDNGDDTFSGTIPGQSAGSEVWYNITATDVGGLTVSTVTQYYTIFLAASDYLFYYNTEDYASWIDYYYLANSDLYGQTDFWSGPYYGSASSDLLANYMGVVEVSGSGPANIDTTTIGAWLDEGDHGYVLSGDEWLGAQTGWTNTTYSAGQFIYDYLGISADYNDINYMAAGDQNGVSRLGAVSGDIISGDLFDFLGDSLALNYDPSYELGLSNWLDGVDVVAGFDNAFTAFTGTIDTTGAPAAGATEYPAAPYKTHTNGSKTVFLGFDPLCTNSQGINDTAPHLSGYHWIGTAPYGPLQSAIEYAFYSLDEEPMIVDVDPDTAYMGEYIELTITGQNTVFSQGTQTMVTDVWLFFQQSSSTIYADNLPTEDWTETTLTAEFNIPEEVEEGYWDVKVDHASIGVLTLSDGLYIASPNNYSSTITFMADVSDINGWDTGMHEMTVRGEFNNWEGDDYMWYDDSTGYYILQREITAEPGDTIAWAFKAEPGEYFENDGWEMLQEARIFIFSGDDIELGPYAPDINLIPSNEVFLGVTESGGLPGDTVTVSVWAELPDDYEMYSFLVSVTGFGGGMMNFLSADTIGSMMPGDWMFYYNENDSSGVVITAGAGAQSFTGSGNLFNLSFILSGDAGTSEFVDLFLTDVLFNEDENLFYDTEPGGVLVLSYGDVTMNGSVTPFDASVILQYLVGSVELDDGQADAGDVTQDASLSALDAAIILQFTVGMVDDLPYDGDMNLIAGGDVVISGGSVSPGDVFQMPILLDGGDNVRSYELEFSYDPEVLVYQSLIWNESVSGMTILDNQEDGIVKVSAAGLGAIESGSVTLGYVEFELVDTFDEYETTVTMSRSRLNEKAVVIDGSTAIYTNALLVVDDWGHGGVPEVYALQQNFPNPFNPVTQIRYQLPEVSLVTIQIYDIMGRVVRTLVNSETQITGYRQVTWNALNDLGQPVSAGMYLYVIQAGQFRNTRKMVFMK